LDAVAGVDALGDLVSDTGVHVPFQGIVFGHQGEEKHKSPERRTNTRFLIVVPPVSVCGESPARMPAVRGIPSSFVENALVVNRKESW
jgi:hypothetical protein